jgi:hypothetical protein
MKIPKEQIFVIIVGLFLLSYLLEAIVDPLKLNLATPYAYLSAEYLTKYPFTTATILIRALSLFWTPLFLLSFVPRAYFAKVGILLVVGALAQLYSLQEVASGTTLIPLEWSLSLSIAGAALILPLLILAIQGLFFSAKNKFAPDETEEEMIENKNENN